MRQQLQQEFEHKKETLVEHFKAQEAQLRLCMAREVEMMHKVHQAKQSRVKIDESESKLVRDELSAARQRLQDLEAQNLVLAHSSEDLAQQNQRLQHKVTDLEESVRSEMASRAEMVDTLAATVRGAEEREKALQQQVADATAVIDKQSFVANAKVKELRAALVKTTEVLLVMRWASRNIGMLMSVRVCRKKTNCKRSSTIFSCACPRCRRRCSSTCSAAPRPTATCSLATRWQVSWATNASFPQPKTQKNETNAPSDLCSKAKSQTRRLRLTPDAVLQLGHDVCAEAFDHRAMDAHEYVRVERRVEQLRSRERPPLPVRHAHPLVQRLAEQLQRGVRQPPRTFAGAVARLASLLLLRSAVLVRRRAILPCLDLVLLLNRLLS